MARLCVSPRVNTAEPWGAGHVVYLAPDGADFGGLAAVKTHTLVEDAAAHGVALHVVVVALHKGCLLVAFLFGERFDIFVADGVERILAPMLVGTTGLGYGICFVVAFFTHILAEVLVMHLVAIFAFHSLACGLGHFKLDFAMLFDFFMGNLEGFEEFGFRNLVHFAFNHHDIVVGGTDHQLHIGLFKLLESGVDYEFTVDTGNTHFRDRAVEGDVAASDGGRCGKPCKSVGAMSTPSAENMVMFTKVSAW